MSALEQLVLVWQCVLYALRQLLRLELWVPWLLLGALQLSVVGCVWAFAHPALSWFMAPLLTAMAGEEALHYPHVFRVLPAVFARADLLVGITAGAITIGASTVLFAARFAGQPARPVAGLGLALRRAGTLVLVNLPLTLLVLGLSIGLEAATAARGSSGMTRRIVRLATLCGAIGLQALFLYVNALVVVSGRNALGALAALPATAARGFWAALALSAFGLVSLLPFQALTGAVDAIVDRGRPELVGVVLMGQVAATMLVGFILTGAATLVYQSSLTTAEDP